MPRRCAHDHFETFRAHAAGLREGEGLPGFLEQEFGRRERLERVCRYVLRPPVAQDRLAVTSAGRVRLALRHLWSDGTTHLEFDPVAFLERLAVLVPRPRVNLILYHGVLAPRAAGRSDVVPRDVARREGAPPNASYRLLAIGLEARDALVPRRRSRRRGIPRPVVVGPFERVYVLRVDAEVEEIFLRNGVCSKPTG